MSINQQSAYLARLAHLFKIEKFPRPIFGRLSVPKWLKMLVEWRLLEGILQLSMILSNFGNDISRFWDAFVNARRDREVRRATPFSISQWLAVNNLFYAKWTPSF